MGGAESVMRNKGLWMKAKKCPYEGVIAPTALFGAEAWGMRSPNDVAHVPMNQTM